MAKILVDEVPPEIWLEIVVTRLARLRLVGGNDRCAVVDQQSDVAFEPDRVAEIISGRKNHRATTGCGRRIDRLVDGRGVESVSISRCAVVADIEGIRGSLGVADSRSEFCERRSSQPAENSAPDKP